jgi:hypothetical protein
MYSIEHVCISRISRSPTTRLGMGTCLASLAASDLTSRWSWQERPGHELITCWLYVYSFEALIGGLLNAGFELPPLTKRAGGDVRAALGSLQRVAGYVPILFTVRWRLRA